MLRGCGACMGIFGIFWDFLGGLLVRHVIPRGFAVPLCGLAQAQMCRWGMLACLMATAVCGVRGRGACMGIFGIFWEFLGGLLVRHDIPRGFAVPQSGMARVQSYRGGMQRSALPQGYARLFDGCGGMRVARA